jgi:hypothetical protein
MRRGYDSEAPIDGIRHAIVENVIAASVRCVQTPQGGGAHSLGPGDREREAAVLAY